MSKRQRKQRAKRATTTAALIASLKAISTTAREDVRTPMGILAYQLGRAHGAAFPREPRPSPRSVDTVYL